MRLINSNTSIPHTRKDAAIELGKKGLQVHPLCWPDEEGNCACGKGHTGHDVGKAPLTTHGWRDSSNSIKTIWEWYDRWPSANIGIDLSGSGLVVVAPDSPEWHWMFLERGLPETAVAQSGGGQGHLHYYYRAGANVPQVRINRSDEYDLMSNGYMVAVGSLHQSGLTYEWITDYPWKDVEDSPYAPQWVLDALQEKGEAQQKTPVLDYHLPEDVELPTKLLKGTLAEWWDGTVSAKHPDGTVDRSLTPWVIGLLLARQGAAFEAIVSSLRDRDFVLGLALLHEWPVVLSWRYETQKASLRIAINPAQDYREERPIPDKQLA